MQVEYKTIDPKLIVNEIRNGHSLETVQKLFGLKFKGEVQELYMKGLVELGEIPKMGFRKRGASPTSAKPVCQAPSALRPQNHSDRAVPVAVIRTGALRTIGQSGSITLNRALLVDDLGFRVGDGFEISREEDKIILKRIKDSK